MSVLERTENQKPRTRQGSYLPVAYTRDLYYDTDAASLQYKSLPGNKAIIDGSGFFRTGINFGPTFQNQGKTSVAIRVSLQPRQYAFEVEKEGQSALVLSLEDSWTDLATIDPGDSFSVGGDRVFTLIEVTFTAGPNIGHLAIASV